VVLVVIGVVGVSSWSSNAMEVVRVVCGMGVCACWCVVGGVLCVVDGITVWLCGVGMVDFVGCSVVWVVSIWVGVVWGDILWVVVVGVMFVVVVGGGGCVVVLVLRLLLLSKFLV
jgi:hypothetical protein